MAKNTINTSFSSYLQTIQHTSARNGAHLLGEKPPHSACMDGPLPQISHDLYAEAPVRDSDRGFQLGAYWISLFAILVFL